MPPPALFDNKQQSQPHGTFLAGPRGDGTALRVASVGKLLWGHNGVEDAWGQASTTRKGMHNETPAQVPAGQPLSCA